MSRTTSPPKKLPFALNPPALSVKMPLPSNRLKMAYIKLASSSLMSMHAKSPCQVSSIKAEKPSSNISPQVKRAKLMRVYWFWTSNPSTFKSLSYVSAWNSEATSAIKVTHYHPKETRQKSGSSGNSQANANFTAQKIWCTIQCRKHRCRIPIGFLPARASSTIAFLLLNPPKV